MWTCIRLLLWLYDKNLIYLSIKCVVFFFIYSFYQCAHISDTGAPWGHLTACIFWWPWSQGHVSLRHVFALVRHFCRIKCKIFVEEEGTLVWSLQTNHPYKQSIQYVSETNLSHEFLRPVSHGQREVVMRHFCRTKLSRGCRTWWAESHRGRRHDIFTKRNGLSCAVLVSTA